MDNNGYNNYNNYNNFNPNGFTNFTAPGDYRDQLEQAKKKEKKAIFVNASKLGGLLLLYNVFNSLFVNAFYIICYCLYHGGISFNMKTVKTYLVEEQSELVTSSAFSMTANLFVVVMSLAALLIIAVCFMKIDIKSMLKPQKGCVKQAVQWAPLCVTLNLLVGIVIGIFVQMMSQSGVTVPEADFTITKPSAYSVIIQFVYVCLIGPVVEEIVYRGLIIKLLSPFGNGVAIFFSALLFGLMHGNIPQAASAFAGALIYASVAVYCKSIVPTIIIHIINNVFASLTDIGDAVGWSSASEFYLAIEIVMLFAGLYMMFVGLKALIKNIRETEPACALTVSRRNIAVLTNVFMLIYLIMLICEFISSFIRYNS